MKPERVSCLKLNVPTLFADDKFRAWLDQESGPIGHLATWHRASKKMPDEYSDVFISYDHGEGSESPQGCLGFPHGPAMPEHCWMVIERLAGEADFQDGLLWLTNLVD